MRAAMISDAHLQGLDDPAQHRLVALLDGLETDHLYLLGDLFHFWWGFPDAVFSEFVPVLAALDRLRRRGVPVTFVPGNHDFAVGPYLVDELGIEVCSAHRRSIDGVAFHLAHGDEADRSRTYALTRAVLRSRAFDLAMRSLGPRRAYALLSRLAGSSRMRGGDAGPLLAAQQTWARRELAAGAEVVVMGHVHVPLVLREAQGTIVHLGDWVEHRTWLEVEGGRVRLLCGLEGRPWRAQEEEGATRSRVSGSSSN